MTTLHQKRAGTDFILPILAITLSLASMTSTYDLSNIYSLLVSLVGIVAGILFFLNNKLFSILIQIWMYAQFPSITRTIKSTLENGMNLIVEQNILDGGQFLKFPIGLTLDTKAGVVELYLNIIPFAFLILFKIFQISSLIGNQVTITKFREDNKLGDIFPLTGTITKRVQVLKDKYWVLADLENDFIYNNQNYKQLLLKSKDGQIYKAGITKHISHVRLVSSTVTIGDKIDNIDNFPFVDWGLVEIGK